MMHASCKLLISLSLVANRCIPTFVDLQDLINNTLNFNATGTPKNVSNYLTQVNLESILSGSV